MPKKKPAAASEPSQYVLVDRRHPLNALPPAERQQAATLARRPAGKRINLPPKWREVVCVVCSRPWTQPVLARALGFSIDTLQARVKDTPELGALISECDANFLQRVLHPITERALAGDASCAMWLAARLDPKRFGDKPTAISLQVNNTAPTAAPAPFTPADFLALVDEARKQASLPSPTADAKVPA